MYKLCALYQQSFKAGFEKWALCKTKFSTSGHPQDAWIPVLMH